MKFVLGFLYGSIDASFASVNDTFMGSKMSNFHVLAEIIFEPIKWNELHRL